MVMTFPSTSKRNSWTEATFFECTSTKIYYENKEPAPAGDFFYYRGSFSGTFLGKVVGFSKKKLLRGFSLLGHIFPLKNLWFLLGGAMFFPGGASILGSRGVGPP